MTVDEIDNLYFVTKDSSKDEIDFASVMTGVKRLENDRVNVFHQKKTKPIVRVQTNEKQSPDFADMPFEHQHQLHDSHFDHGIQRKLQRKIRQGQLPVDDCLDLHGCTQKMAHTELSIFFNQASIAAHKFVIVVHGKGQRSENFAVLKPLVLHWLSQQNSVLAWCPAQPKDGGSGASYVYLR